MAKIIRDMKNRCILRKCAAILALTITTAFMLVACAKEPAVEEPTGSITITTTLTKVAFTVAGAKNISIDWGDGKKGKANDATFLDSSDLFEFSHSYSGKTAHNIVITGNVARLFCLDIGVTALDVSNNTALEWLSCGGNQLTTLDVSKNTALTFLSIDGNQITTLDVSKNTALEQLYIIGSQLKKLDVSANAALTHLNIRNSQLLTGSALNDLFRTLPDDTKTKYGRAIYIGGNPGYVDCDPSIAEKKGWIFITSSRY